MISLGNRIVTARILASIVCSLAGTFAAGCSADVLSGTWQQEGATTPLPPDPGGDLEIDARLVLDATPSPASLDLHLDLSYMGLIDVIDLEGSYAEAGRDLTVSVTGFTVDPASGNTTYVDESGAQCIMLMGFGGAPVCFPTPQTNAYTVSGDTLTMTIDHAILGAPSETRFSLTRAE